MAPGPAPVVLSEEVLKKEVNEAEKMVTRKKEIEATLKLLREEQIQIEKNLLGK